VQRARLHAAAVTLRALSVALDPNDAEARTCFGEQLLRRRDYEGALAEIEAALTISPNVASAQGAE